MPDMCKFLDDLFSFRGLYLNNNDIDVRVIDFPDDNSYSEFCSTIVAGRDAVKLLVKNKCRGLEERCPYFYFIVVNYGTAKTTNYKLETFLAKIGVHGVSSRCDDVVVIGMTDDTSLGTRISIPSCLYVGEVDSVEVGINGEVDMACLHSCALELNRKAKSLCDIPGMWCLPIWLPVEVQQNILSFCISPTAELVKNEMQRINDWWSFHLDEMYYQRQWKEVPTSPYIISVPSVADVMRSVTRPFLVPDAKTPPLVFLRPWNL